MRLNRDIKILMMIVAFAALALIVINVAVNQLLSEKVMQSTFADLIQIKNMVSTQQKYRLNHLANACYLLNENLRIKTLIELNRPDSLNHIFEKLSNKLGTDFYLVTNNKGEIIAGEDPGNFPRHILKSAGNIAYNNPQAIWTGYLCLDQHLYQIATVSVFNKDHFVGRISFGSAVGKSQVEQYKKDVNTDVTLFYENIVKVSTIGDSVAEHYLDKFKSFANEHRPIFDAVKITQLPSDVFTTQLGVQEVYALLCPLGKNDPVFLLVTISTLRATTELRSLQNQIINISIICFVIIFVAAIFLRKWFYSPSRKLITADIEYQPEIIPPTLPESQNIAILLSVNKENSIIESMNKTLQLQTEIAELYNGTVCVLNHDKLLVRFEGTDGLDRAIDGAITMQKILKKESRLGNSPISISLHYDKVKLGAYEKDSYAVPDTIIDYCLLLCSLAKCGQILIKKKLLDHATINYIIRNVQIMSIGENSDQLEIVEICI